MSADTSGAGTYGQDALNPVGPVASDLGVPGIAVPDDAIDEDEWEYEYSTTETETYYLTIDLSYPEFRGQAAKNPHRSRGGYYKHWLGQTQAYPEPAADAAIGDDGRNDPQPDPDRPQVDQPQKDQTKDDEPQGNQSQNDQTQDDQPLVNEQEEEPWKREHHEETQPMNQDTAPEIDHANIDPALFVTAPAFSSENENMQLKAGQVPDRRAPLREEEAEEEGGEEAEEVVEEEEDEEDEEEEEEEEEEDDDDDDGQVNTGGASEDIQVLDLHSDRPLISYRGRVFEGQWAEVIGTEAIFAHRDEYARNSLPALRNLPENVDFLAASASRILTQEKTIEPKEGKEDSLAAIRKEWNIKIPRGRDKNGEKVKQVNFLERLIALKMKKGETDRVTVYARDGEGKNFKDGQDPGFRPRPRKQRKEITWGSQDGASTGDKRKRSRGSRARPRPRLQGESRGILHRDIRPGGLSTPTPKQWNDLDSGEEERDEDELEDEEEEEDDEDEEIGDADSEDGSEADSDQRADSHGSDASSQSDQHEYGVRKARHYDEDVSMAED